MRFAARILGRTADRTRACWALCVALGTFHPVPAKTLQHALVTGNYLENCCGNLPWNDGRRTGSTQAARARPTRPQSDARIPAPLLGACGFRALRGPDPGTAAPSGLALRPLPRHRERTLTGRSRSRIWLMTLAL